MYRVGNRGQFASAFGEWLRLVTHCGQHTLTLGVMALASNIQTYICGHYF